ASIAGHRSSFDLSIGRVDEFGPRQPLRPERKHVLIGRDRAAVDEQTSASGVRDVRSTRTPPDAVRHLTWLEWLQQPLVSVGVHGPDAVGVPILRHVPRIVRSRKACHLLIGGGPRPPPAVALRPPPPYAPLPRDLPAP